MKIRTATVLCLVGIILLAASLPTEWFDLKNATLTYALGGKTTVPDFPLTALNCTFSFFGMATPIWIIVLVSEIGLIMVLLRSMKWASIPLGFCLFPLVISLLAIAYGLWNVIKPSADDAYQSGACGIGVLLAGFALAMGFGALFMKESARSEAPYGQIAGS